MVNLDELSKAIINGDSDAAFEMTKKALDANIPASEILDKVLFPVSGRLVTYLKRASIFYPN